MSRKANARLKLLEMRVTPPSAESGPRFWAWWRSLPRDDMEARWQEMREDAPSSFFSSPQERQEWIETGIRREMEVEKMLQAMGYYDEEDIQELEEG